MSKSIVFALLVLSLAFTPLGPVHAENVPAENPATGASIQQGARVVSYTETDIIPIRARLRYSTLIILPPDEEIMDFTTGDKEFWIINGVHNLCYVHPAQAGIRSNLNLITASGHVYSFLLTEISKDKDNDKDKNGGADAEPDLKVFVTLAKQSPANHFGAGAFVPASEVQAYKDELAAVRSEAARQIKDGEQQAEQRAEQQMERFRRDYPGKLVFDYTLDQKARRAPFLVSAIYHDDRFTYIQCAAREKPTVYEIKDKKPNLINFDLENSVYVIPKILDNGYLVAGRKRVIFRRNPANAELAGR